MEKVLGFLGDLYAYLAALPFGVFALVWIAYYMRTQDRKLASTRAIDITMVFLVGAVAALLDQVISLSIGGIWLILLIFLISIGLIGNAQQRLKGKVDAAKAIRVVWRVGFLILSVLYILLLLIGILVYTLR